ncbi:hypothetical protein C1H46_018005 [Malus baccata]|nr:hypothetical protein C1H46_018005 [Malus baccata]
MFGEQDTSLKQTGGIQRPILRWVLSEPLLYSASRFSFSSVHGFEPASASDAEFGLAS